MATIAICVLPEAGHYYPTFRIARGLAARGHRVVYLTLPDDRPFVEREGLAAVELFPDLFPAGSVTEWRRRARGLPPLSRAELIALAQADSVKLAAWEDGRADRLLDDVAPDLVVGDSLYPMLALVARARGLPAVLVNVILPADRAPGLPPPVRPLLPDDSQAGRLRIAWEWQQCLGQRASQLSRWLLHLGIGLHYPEAVHRLAERAGLGGDGVCDDTAFGPVPRLPELILCPRDFDFPRPVPHHRRYVEASVDLEGAGRGELPDLDPEKLPDLDPESRRPVIFCALGSQGELTPGAGRLLKTVISAAARRRDLRFLVAAEPDALPAGAEPPANVRLVGRVDQVRLLRRVALTVTHGGLGTIKECVLAGVPMVVCPLVRDQPGNAARVAYHGLGAIGSTEDPVALAGALGEALEAPAVRERVETMRERFAAVEARSPSLDAIEAHLDRA